MALSTECSDECNRLVFEAARENSVSKLKLGIGTYSEIHLLASLAQCNEEGETPLLVAIKVKNSDVINELVTVLRDCDHKVNEHQLISVFDQLFHRISTLELIDFLIRDIKDENWLKFIGQVLINSTSLTRPDKIIALELLGAILINICITREELPSVLKYWKESMTLRHLPSDGGPLFPKIPAACVPSVSSNVVFGSAVEVMTAEELDLLQEDFERNNLSLDSVVRFLCWKRMKIQALLVIRRISNQANHGNLYWFYLNSLMQFYKDLKKNAVTHFGLNKYLTNIFLLIMEQMNGFGTKMLPAKSFDAFDVFIQILCLLSNNFFKMLREPPGSPEREELSYANLLVPTEFINTISQFFPNPSTISLERSSFVIFVNFDGSVELEDFCFAALVYRYLFILEFISPQITDEEKQKLEGYYSKYIRNFFPDRTTNVLHVAVEDDICKATSDARLKTIKLILKLGADPNAIDEIGQTPLFILADTDELPVLVENLPIFQTLVDAGTHLDTAIDDGDTVLSVLNKTLGQDQNGERSIHPYYKSLLNTVFPLSCYAARVIRRHGIPFDEDRLPFHLQEFVQRHSAKDFADD